MADSKIKTEHFGKTSVGKVWGVADQGEGVKLVPVLCEKTWANG